MWLVGAVFEGFAPQFGESTGGVPCGLRCNTSCPCLLLSLLFCLTTWVHRSTFIERNVCLWKMVISTPSLFLSESRRLFCGVIVLFVSVQLLIQQIFKGLPCGRNFLLLCVHMCVDICGHRYVKDRGQLWLSFLMEA